MEKDPDLKLLHEDSRFKELAAYAAALNFAVLLSRPRMGKH
jgi:hypothetical protein